MDVSRFKYRHILLMKTSTTEKFTNPRTGGNKLNLYSRDRQEHCNSLLAQLDRASKEFEQLKRRRKDAGITKKLGMTLTFQSEPDFDLKLESLEFRRSDIELLSVQKKDKTTYASVYVPAGKLEHFIKKVEKYGSEETRKGKPRNQPMVNNISGIRKAALEGLWTDDLELFPKNGEKIWWEVWLRAGKNKDDILNFFRANVSVLLNPLRKSNWKLSRRDCFKASEGF
jgi:hypothetical protein